MGDKHHKCSLHLRRTDAISHNCVINACNTASQWPCCLVLLAELPEHPTDTWTAALASSACQKDRGWQNASLILDTELRQGQPALITCNSVLAVCADAARWEEAVSLFRGFCSARLQPDVVSHNSIISACEKALDWQKPLLFLSMMPVMGSQPTVISYNSTISASEGLGQWLQAVQLLAHASGSNTQPNVITYSAAISSCATGKKWQAAVSLLWLCWEEMELDIVAFNACLTACEKASAWSRALALLSDLIQETGDKNGLVKLDVVSYNSTISACAQAAAWEQALFLLASMDAQSLQPNLITLNSAIAALEAVSAVPGLFGQETQSGKVSLWQQVVELLLQIRTMRLAASMLAYHSAVRVCQAFDEHVLTVTLLGQARFDIAKRRRKKHMAVLSDFLDLECRKDNHQMPNFR